VVEVGEFFFECEWGDGGLCDFGDGSLAFFGVEDVPDHAEETDDAEEDEHAADLSAEGLTALAQIYLLGLVVSMVCFNCSFSILRNWHSSCNFLFISSSSRTLSFFLSLEICAEMRFLCFLVSSSS